jgi:hypothetical protein
MADKTIQELENELSRRKFEEYQAKYADTQKKKNDFRKTRGIDVYTSDDYCGMSNGTYDFYYGYEVTECPVKSHKLDDDCYEEDCDKREWCFTASVNGTEFMRLPTSQLWGEEGEEPFFYLLGGIAQFLGSTQADSFPKPTESHANHQPKSKLARKD